MMCVPMSVFIRYRFFLLLLLLIPVIASTAEKSPSKDVMERYYHAFSKGDVDTMTDLMHPDALRRFKDTIHNALAGNKSELAETELLSMFSVRNIDEFDQLSDVEAYSRMNEIVFQLPDFKNVYPTTRFEYIGETQNEEITYVTFQLGFEISGQYTYADSVQGLKEFKGAMRLMLPKDAETNIKGIEARYQ